jgi:hypothetical protein
VGNQFCERERSWTYLQVLFQLLSLTELSNAAVVRNFEVLYKDKL